MKHSSLETAPEFDGFQKTIQESLKQYQERLHALIKSYLTCKENDQVCDFVDTVTYC